MVIACDGIWDCVSNEECAIRMTEKIERFNCLQQKENMSKPIEELFTEILAPRIDARFPGTDNMTAILVCFHNNQHLRSYQAEKLKVH